MLRQSSVDRLLKACLIAAISLFAGPLNAAVTYTDIHDRTFYDGTESASLLLGTDGYWYGAAMAGGSGAGDEIGRAHV